MIPADEKRDRLDDIVMVAPGCYRTHRQWREKATPFQRKLDDIFHSFDEKDDTHAPETFPQEIGDHVLFTFVERDAETPPNRRPRLICLTSARIASSSAQDIAAELRRLLMKPRPEKGDDPYEYGGGQP